MAQIATAGHITTTELLVLGAVGVGAIYFLTRKPVTAAVSVGTPSGPIVCGPGLTYNAALNSCIAPATAITPAPGLVSTTPAPGTPSSPCVQSNCPSGYSCDPTSGTCCPSGWAYAGQPGICCPPGTTPGGGGVCIAASVTAGQSPALSPATPSVASPATNPTLAQVVASGQPANTPVIIPTPSGSALLGCPYGWVSAGINICCPAGLYPPGQSGPGCQGLS